MNLAPISPPAETFAPNSLWNRDLAPIPRAERTWGVYNYASLWVAMSVCIPTYMLASGLIAGGMSWKQAIATILLGNLIVLIPMVLNAHAGAKYGIPFPVYVRASFGVRGANIPALLRALVACGWFGIQCWIGGQAIWSMTRVLWSGASAHPAGPWICFFFFWLLNMAVIWRGIQVIKSLQALSAPFMLGVGLLLLFWITRKAGGLGPVLSGPSRFHSTGEFIRFFIPSLTAMVGFWATVALNIPDFTRYARSQRDQMLGQALGLPLAMTLYAFIGVAVTSASVVIFGTAIWDPVALLGRFHQPLVASIALVALLLATLNTNVAANVVSPSNDFSNLAPRYISFRSGGLITGLLGVAMMPWKLLTDFSTYIFGWLVGYSGLLGPIAGIMIADYFVIRSRSLEVEALYRRDGPYEYAAGFNPRALIALAAGISVALIGLFVPALRFLYDYAWFVGFGVSAMIYVALMIGPDERASIPPTPLLLPVEGFEVTQPST
ncbi:MAG TPA: NCS1 family nucleobase:cation symporter-1 [Granulicella sp.]|jgi:NCS1 family nucleobase:cation symporter-1|nr:NCS1 family nucleobase:cation symporter-1 [Granulicella sp.]